MKPPVAVILPRLARIGLVTEQMVWMKMLSAKPLGLLQPAHHLALKPVH